MTGSYLIQLAVLEGKSSRSCFISLPQKWTSMIKHCSLPTFQLESVSTSANIVTNWAGEVHSNGDIIYLNNIMLISNGFEEGEDVYVSQLPMPSPCLSVFAELSSVDDWNNLAINHESIQSSMLDKVRVVKVDQIVPLWLEGGCLVLLRINGFGESCFPIHILADSTVVNIAPPNRPVPSQLSASPDNMLENANHTDEQTVSLASFDIFNLVTSSFKRGFPLTYGSNLPQKAYIYEILSFRKFPDNLTDTLHEFLKYHPSILIVGKSMVLHSKYENSSWFETNIERVKTNKSSNEKSKTQHSEAQNILKAVCLAIVWENFSLEKSIPTGVSEEINSLVSGHSCIVCDTLIAALSLSDSDVIEVDSKGVNISYDKATMDYFPLTRLTISSEDFLHSLRNAVKAMCDVCPLILNDTVVIAVPVEGNNVKVLLLIRNETAVFIDHISCSVVSFNLLLKPTNATIPDPDYSKVDRNVHNKKGILYNELFNTLLVQIQESLTLSDIKSQFILLEGCERSGKTNICLELGHYFQYSPVYCNLQSVKSLKGKKPDTLQRTLIRSIHLCLLNQPSILIIDDLDYLIPSQQLNNQDEGPLHEYGTQISVILRNILSQLTKISGSNQSAKPHKLKLVILVTCKSRSQINSIVSAPNGHNLFPIIYEMPSLNLDLKLAYILKFINSTIDTNEEAYIEKMKNLNLTFTNDRLKGMIQTLSLPELKSLSRRAITEAKVRWKNLYEDSTMLVVCEDDFMKACKDMIPLSVKEINKQDQEPGKYIIGGLLSPQRIIKQSILWPLQHPRIFSQVGLNVRTGILLFGPPGCGKTLLANSIAASCNLNFISVKGPELLSKYIGQSEKSVRDIFIRGRNASPCVLFFDEFDALAPRRGHDNTGVTDRVVNQLLTQMDGVEGNDGVFILAATSRPDLIDPALLRPGRLDKPVYCPIPDESERAQIFEVLSKTLPLTESPDWKVFAGLTDQLTGADIQGILSTAQVVAAQEILGTGLYSGLKLSDSGPKRENGQPLKYEDVGCSTAINVQIKHIFQAIKTTKRSVSAVEMKKYQDIYRNFNTDDCVTPTNITVPGMKYTLA